MVEIKSFKQLALSFDNAQEQPHFEKPSFRVGKKIFATLDLVNRKAVLKLSEVDQSVFCAFDKAVIYPVDGTWGKQGWTVVTLDQINRDMLVDALTCAYCNTAPKQLAAKYQRQ